MFGSDFEKIQVLFRVKSHVLGSVKTQLRFRSWFTFALGQGGQRQKVQCGFLGTS
ncbi:hypothetical protein HanRHA438_Chr05g0244131 [Helianthus annuus]|nr:hypothetical protein HanRHA438_Chr05g0244131 [Helianthus annuus]